MNAQKPSISQQFAQVFSGGDQPRACTLAQLGEAGDWSLALAHDHPEHLLIWITRGQARALLDGAQRGVGVHNALFVPARHLIALEPGRQCFGHVLCLPAEFDSAPPLPAQPMLLRVLERGAQADLTGLFDGMMREQTARSANWQHALGAMATLAVIWLHRQIENAGEIAPPDTAAQRLVSRFCRNLCPPPQSLRNVADHAATLGVTPTHLSRSCRTATGRTAAALLAEVQLHRARRLLGQTDAQVGDIARFLGFRSAAYFTQFLIRHTGKPASRLRAMAPARPSAMSPANKSDVANER